MAGNAISEGFEISESSQRDVLESPLASGTVPSATHTGPPREFEGPGANLLWGPHDINIIIFKLDPTRFN